METIRRISAFVIALSLALPQWSCMNAGQLEIHYPLSNADSALSIAVIVGLFVVPLLALLLRRKRLTSLLVGLIAVAAGLYVISYASILVGTHLLLGWYTYTVGALAYFAASLFELTRALVPGKSFRAEHPNGPPR